MSVVKAIKILAESAESWETATQDAVNAAAKTVEDNQTVYIESFQAVAENSKIVRYLVDTKFYF